MYRSTKKQKWAQTRNWAKVMITNSISVLVRYSYIFTKDEQYYYTRIINDLELLLANWERNNPESKQDYLNREKHERVV